MKNVVKKFNEINVNFNQFFYDPFSKLYSRKPIFHNTRLIYSDTYLGSGGDKGEG